MIIRGCYILSLKHCCVYRSVTGVLKKGFRPSTKCFYMAIYNQPIPIFQVTSIYVRKVWILRANNCTKGRFFSHQCLAISQFLRCKVIQLTIWRCCGRPWRQLAAVGSLPNTWKVDLSGTLATCMVWISGIWIIYWFGVCEFMIDGWTGLFMVEELWCSVTNHAFGWQLKHTKAPSSSPVPSTWTWQCWDVHVPLQPCAKFLELCQRANWIQK